MNIVVSQMSLCYRIPLEFRNSDKDGVDEIRRISDAITFTYAELRRLTLSSTK